MRVLFAGTPQAAVPSLDAIADSAHTIVAVLTRPDAPAGRGRSARRSPVGQRADELGLPVLTPPSMRDADVAAQIQQLDADVAAIVAYGGLIPPAVLQLPRHGWINLHFSLLPRWRWAAPVQHAIAAGDAQTGVSIFQLEEGLDTGPVYRRTAVPIEPTHTAGELLTLLADVGAHELRGTLDDIEAGTAQATAQPDDGITLAPKVSVADAEIDFSRLAHEVDQLIRATTPDPGAWCILAGTRIKLGPVEITDTALPAGLVDAGKREVLVGTADRAIRLGTVQPQGKKQMNAADFARGARLPDGTVVTRERQPDD